MRPQRRPPSQAWRTFLTNHANQIMAADFFVVPTVTFRLLFVLVILEHDRRRLVHVAVTEHPTAAWTAQQLRNAFSDNETPRALLHDRDSVFADVATTIAGMNTQAVRTAPRSPWQNAYVERVIGSVRRECLDHVIVLTRRDCAACFDTTSRTICVHEHIWRSARTRRARARSHHRPPVASLPFQKSAVCITVSTASPRSRCPE
jgi:transposase InsO family protein